LNLTKNKNKLALLAVLALLAALTLAGCSGKKEPAAMIVNDVEIPQGVLNYYINYGKDYLTSYGIDINDPETGAQYLSLIEEQGVDIVKEIAVVRSLAQQAELTVDSAALAEALQAEKNYFNDDAAWQEWLTTYQLSEADVQWILEYQLLSEELYEYVNQDITMSDEEIAAVYAANPADYDSYKFAHILIVPDGEDDAAWAAAQQTAKDVLAEINNGSTTFEEVAAQHNPDSTKATGGDLGQYVTQSASPYVAEFSEAAFALTEIGQITAEPVRSSFGYHLIKLLDKTTGAESARDAIIEQELGLQRTENYNNYLNDAIANAVVNKDYVRQYAVVDDGTDNADNADNSENNDNTDNAGNTENTDNTDNNDNNGDKQ